MLKNSLTFDNFSRFSAQNVINFPRVSGGHQQGRHGNRSRIRRRGESTSGGKEVEGDQMVNSSRFLHNNQESENKYVKLYH